MALIPAKCTNCGANIQVDETKEAGICEACGTAFVTEKAINNYNNITNVTNNIQTQVINITNAKNDFVIRAGTLEKYKGASVDVVIPNNVMTIGEGAFKNCKRLKSVSIPDSVTWIEREAFYGCESLEMITIPSGIDLIEEYVFFGCTSLKQVNFTRLVDIGAYAFSECYDLEKFDFTDDLGVIGEHAFESCWKLKSANLPNSVFELGVGAFKFCSKISEISIPSSLTCIEESCFAYCDELTSVVIPSSVTSIKYNAFGGCKKLKQITIPDSVTEVVGIYDEITVIASETWKKQHYQSFTSLSMYGNTAPKAGCYIATCVYGSYDCPQVWTLRRYRDDTLGAKWYGRFFIRVYYAVSPALVKWFGKTSWFKRMWQGKLDKMVARLNGNGVENTPYQDKEW